MAVEITATAPLTLVAGGPSVHVTVADQQGLNSSGAPINPLAPASVTWAASSVVNITADATGFNFSAVARSTPFSFSLAANYTTQTPNVSTSMPINIVLPGVTSLTFSTP